MDSEIATNIIVGAAFAESMWILSKAYWGLMIRDGEIEDFPSFNKGFVKYTPYLLIVDLPFITF